MTDRSRRSALRAIGGVVMASLSGCLETGTDATTTRATSADATTTAASTERTEAATTDAESTSDPGRTDTQATDGEDVSTVDWTTAELPGTITNLWLAGRPPTPETSGGPLYVATDAGTVAAVDVVDGAVQWQHTTAGHTEHGRPSVHRHGGTVYAVSDTLTRELLRSYVEALDPATGRRAWTFEAREFLTPLGVVDGRLYLAGHVIRAPPSELGPNQSPRGDGYLHAVDARTGEELWSVSVPRLTGAAVAAHGLYAVEEQSLETDLDWLRAVDLDGTERWTVETGTQGPADPVPTETAVLAGADDGVGRYDPASGDLAWQVGQWERGPGEITVIGDAVLAGGNPLVAVGHDGTVRYWIRRGGRVVRPATADTLYCSKGVAIQAVDRDAGRVRWHYRPSDATYTHPRAVVGDGLLVANGIGTHDEFVLLGAEAGEPRGSVRAPGSGHFETAAGLGDRLLAGVGSTVRAYEIDA